MDSLSFIKDDQVDSGLSQMGADESTLSFPPSTPPVEPLPKNSEEVAAQLAAANKVPDYKAGIMEYLGKMESMGQTPLHTKVWEDRRQADIQTAKDMAISYAQQGDAEGINSTLKAVTDKYAGITSPSKAQAYIESAKEAVENISYSKAKDHATMNDFVNTVDSVAEKMAAANILQQSIAESINRLEEKTGKIDYVTDFLGMLAPGSDYIASTKLANSITGKDTLNKYEAYAALANKLIGMSKQEQDLVFKQIEEASAGFYGLTVDRPAIMRFLSSFRDYTSSDYLTDQAFNALDTFAASDILKGARAVVRAGKNVVAISETAGKDAAGKVVASDMTKGTNVSGLTDQERIDSALAAGKIPMEADPARVVGMSSTVQEELKAAQRKLYAETEDRLRSSGLTEDEIKTELARIKSQYDPTTNKSVSSVIYGEGDESGQKMTVYWQSKDGKPFLSREAAESYMKEHGIVGEVVEKKLPSTPTVSSNLDEHEKAFYKSALGDFKEEVQAKWSMAEDTDRELHIAAGEMLKKVAEAEKLLDKPRLTSAEQNKLDRLFLEFEDFSTGARTVEEEVGIPIFENGARFAYSGQVSEDVKGLMTDLANIFGIKRNVVVSTFEDFGNIARRDPYLAAIIDEVAKAGKRGKGAYTGTLVSGEETHLVLLGKNLSKKDLLLTAVHELGHAFDKEFLLRSEDSATLRNALEQDFGAWLFKHNNAEGRAFKEFMAKRQLLVGRTDLAQDIARGTVNSLDDLTPSFQKWTKMFDEYWADQFAKFALTDAKPVTAVEKYFRSAYEAVLRAYEYLADKLGIKFDASKPEKIIRDYLADHVKRVANGETIPLAPWALEYSISKNIKSGVKPRIKLKTKAMAEEAAKDSTGYLVKEQRLDPLAYTKEGFSPEDIKSMPWIAVDPKHGASELLVAERVIGVHAEAKLKKTMSDYIKPFYDKLSKTERARVGAVLTEGDAYSDIKGSVGKEFNYMELVGKGLNENEIKAYFAYRGLRQYTWAQRNADQVRHLTALGQKEIGLTLASDTGPVRRKFVGKQMLVDEANGSVHGKIIFDSRTGTTIKITNEVLDDIKREGGGIVELFQPEKLNGKMHKYVVSHPNHSSIKNITTAVPYRPGEFSRIYTDEYFITVSRNAEIDGKASTWLDTIRTATSEREAKEFITALNGARALMRAYTSGSIKIKDIDASLEKILGKYIDPNEFKKEYINGEFDNVASVDFHYSRNKEEYLNGSINEAISSGRVFVSKRGERLYSVDARRPNTLDVFQSIQAEMANVSRVMSVSQWRENAIRRWMNSFGDKIPNRTGNDVADFFRANNMLFSKRDQASLFAERSHAYIMRQIGVKTNEEVKYDAFTRALTEKYFTGNEGMEVLGSKIRQKSFLGLLRNINFNLTLGMWNPAQLLVQANGAATAIALSPLHGLKSIKTFPLLRLALMSDRPDVWKQIAGLQKLSDMGLSSSEDFIKLVQGVRKSGIIDNLKSTSLFNLEEGATDVFGGYASKVWNTNAVFFNRGEEFSRLVSFDVARREWQAANKGLDWASDAGLKEIVKRMDNLTQNMTKANLAGFQTGAISVPFQFLQYNIKLAANVVSSLIGGKRGFTRTEAAKLLAGHLVLYGTAGNGVAWLVDEMLGEKNKNTLTVEQKTYIGQGLMAGLINSISEVTTGEHTQIAVGSRLGTFDYYQRVADAVFKDPANIYDALLGPTAATAQRLGVVADVAALWHADPDVSSKDILEGIIKIGTAQVSSLRSATKAYIYYTNEGKMTDKSGNVVGKVNESEILAQAIGFQPTVAVDTYNLYQSKKDHDQTIKELAGLISSVQKDIIFELQKGTEEGRQRALDKKKTLQALWPNNAGDLFEVQREIKDKIYPYDSQFQKLLGEYVWHGYNYEQPLVITKEPK